jgi:hypothetical protein
MPVILFGKEFISMVQSVTRSVSHSPANLLAGFTKGRIGRWLLVSVAGHVLFIALLSLGYIRDRWIDPNGAILRKEAAEAAKAELLKATAKPVKPEAKSVAPSVPAPAAAGSNAPAPTAGEKTSPAASSNSTDTQILADRKNSEGVKGITEVAKPSEIPAQPGDSSALLDDALKR